MGLYVLGEVFIFVLIVVAIIFWKRWRYIPAGKTKGVCIKVKTEISPLHREYNDGHMDSRMYRPYVKYDYDGECYIARSVIAYNNSKFLPGDEVSILVNNKNRKVIRILE